MLYAVIFIFLALCTYNHDIRNKEKGKNMNYFISFLLLFLMSALRYRVGGDALFYEDYYKNLPPLADISYFVKFQNNLLFMPLWIFFNAICKSLSDNYVFYQIAHALTFNLILFSFIKKYSSKPFSVLLLFFTSLLYFYYSFEIQREVLAVGVFMLNIDNLENKKWVRYYSLAIISFLFHESAIILFFLPFFRLVKFNRKFIICILIGSVIIFITRDFILNRLYILLFLEQMQKKGDIYFSHQLSTLGFIAFYFVRVILFIPISFYLSSYKNKALKYNWFFSSFLCISVMSQFFVGFDRLLNYLYPLYIVIVMDILYNNSTKMKSIFSRNVIILTIFLHIFFIIEYKLFIKNKYGDHYYSLFFPYSSIFVPEDNRERENFYYGLWD